MQPIIGSRPDPFRPADIAKLEDLLIYARGQPVKLSPEAQSAYDMWRLVKKGFLKPYAYFMSYDSRGCPIVYKDDIDLLLFLDSLNDRGAEHQRKKQEQMSRLSGK